MSWRRGARLLSNYNAAPRKGIQLCHLKLTLRVKMSSLAKQPIGARVHARAHLALGEAESKRFYGSLYKETLVSGEVFNVETEAGKGRKSVFLLVRWDSLAGQRDRRISLRSITLGNPPVVPLEQPQPQDDSSIISRPRVLEQERLYEPESEDAYITTQEIEPSPHASSLQNHTTYDAHGVVWKQREVLEPVGGAVPRRMWEMRGIGGHYIVEGGDSGTSATRSPIDYFMAALPHGHLLNMVKWTSEGLQEKGKRGVSTGELLKFIGILVLGTRYQFGKRRELWAVQAKNRLLSAPCFGTKTGMPRNRFEDIWSSLVFSKQGERAANELSEVHRWRLIDDFVEALNHHRATNFVPSDLICVNEIMSRWYWQGGKWIEHGLPQYVAIDCKPENGCEIQNSACGRSGVMMQLQLVTTAEHEEERHIE